jgi:hypothetical protein
MTKTRAQKMVEVLARPENLDLVEGRKDKSRVRSIRQSDTPKPGSKEKLKAALRRLNDFKDDL